MDGVALRFRRIDPERDGGLCFAHYRDAAVATFGPGSHEARASRYLPWLRGRVEEFPDGHVLAYLGEECVGQLELQVPYGVSAGYVNLFYVARGFRRQGMGRRLHEFAERYFRAWEATTVDLDVSPSNRAAIAFYKSLGYVFAEGGPPPLVRMTKSLLPIANPG